MNKKILITGSTSGIGKLVALELAKDGHELIIHGRSEESVNQAILDIKAESNNKSIKGFAADFSDLDSVNDMADSLNKLGDKIDVLINNAGVYKSANQKNKDRLDMRIVVNYLAPYLFTKKLMSLLNDNSRVINLSSAAQSSVSLELLEGKEDVSEGIAYAQSKLALTMWSFYLAKSLNGVSVIAVNPGSLLNTNMVKEAFGHHLAPAEKGAEILHALAVSNEYLNITGKYFDNDRGNFGEAHPDAYNKEKVHALIETTDRLLKNLGY